MPHTEALLFPLAMIALVAEAMTAALAAGRRKMDWLGVAMLGCITALGGGSVRDVLLGHHPLWWVDSPYLLLVTGGAALLTIGLARFVHRFHAIFLLLDAIGLVVFTIMGCNIALGMNQPLLIVVVAGMITGCVGGVLRDVLCNDVPLLFRSELYASVSIVTGLLYIGGIKLQVSPDLVIAAAFAVGLTFRLLAIRLKLEMPKFVYDSDNA
ncbi:trimeric intracellular cation channel family protein [Rhodopseudomonas sp. P2A-2r]|uniref:trimeric intracellular cation channel family protein n=1 Tax=Rhodopseudomonas sp. P2A-2r TaxID=2991972 RepID=UPI002234B950|nr:trimeric intracellular cation channel family protein [Rhodopseudomonas sp. P2A-2r]UZE51669.1 trimeric intracellular cation channel family protein [Rhodopseudomonas sp. P2A-2r]